MVVHGDGLDELALHGESLVLELRDGEITEYKVTPADFGLQAAPVSALAGGDADRNADLLKQVLSGKGSQAQHHAVAMNVAALLYLSNTYENFKDAAQAALSHIESGHAMRHLQQLQEHKHD